MKCIQHTCCEPVLHAFIFHLEKTCGPVPTVGGMDTGDIMSNEVYYGDDFTFECLTGFTLQGNSSQGDDTVRCTLLSEDSEVVHWDFGDLRCEGTFVVDLNNLSLLTRYSLIVEKRKLFYFFTCSVTAFNCIEVDCYTR